jgi:ankyrin repeat protein
MVNTVGLYHAFDEGAFEKINMFVEAHGANWRTEGDKWNLLHMALLSVSESPRPDVVQHLIGFGVDVNARDRRQWTPLHFAARTKNPAVVRLLIEAGADVNAKDDEGITPLHQGLLQYPVNLEMTEMMLAAGAKTDMLRKYVDVVTSPDKDALRNLLAKYDRTTPAK